jgi:cytochrome d ubiquinol oxidase subunit II
MNAWSDPVLLLGVVMVLLLTLYVLLGGADYGGGVWDLLATGESRADQRATIAHAIAPVWEANHVWLIVVVTILFNAFPPAFARISVVLHVPLSLMLLGIVLRGSAFVFRAYGPLSDRSTRFWGVVFAVSSTLTPVMIGSVVGALTSGGSWFSPFSVAVGGFALVLFAYLAAVYLTLEARQPATAEAFRARALGAAVLTGVMALVVFLLAGDAPHVRATLTTSSWARPLHFATGGFAVAALVLIWRRNFWWARVAAAAQTSLIVWGWALAQYPYLIRPDLTANDAAAPINVLILLTQILFAGAVLLLPALIYLFKLFAPSTRNWSTR